MNKISKLFYITALAASLYWPITATADTLPQVSGLSYEAGTLRWSPVDGATGYNVHYFGEGVGWSYLTTLGNVTAYVPEVSASYIIIAYDGAGNFSPFQINGGGNSNEITIESLETTSDPLPPATEAPTVQLEIVTGASYDGANIMWNALPGAVGYNVHYYYEGVGPAYLTTVGNVTTYAPQVSGYYTIVGYDGAGNFSPYQIDGGIDDTNSVDIESLDTPSTTTPTVEDTPSGQLGIVTGVAFNESTISWNAVNGATGYNVHYAGFEQGLSYLTTIGNVTAYAPEMIGFYIIVAYDNAGNYSPTQIDGGINDTNYVYIESLDDSSTPMPPAVDTPAAQLGIVTGVSFDGLTINWDVLSNAVGYNVHFFYPGVGWSYLTTVVNATSYVPQMMGDYIIVGYDDAGNYGPFQINGGGNSNAIDVN